MNLDEKNDEYNNKYKRYVIEIAQNVMEDFMSSLKKNCTKIIPPNENEACIVRSVLMSLSATTLMTSATIIKHMFENDKQRTKHILGVLKNGIKKAWLDELKEKF